MKVLIIAEAGSVHDGSVGNAKRLIDAASQCGADIVKFQTHIAEAETLREAPNPPYFSEESRYEYFKRTAFTQRQWRALKEHAESQGVGFLSSAFSLEAVELLEDIGLERYKIPSGEVTNIPLLERIAATGKAVLLSSGMSSWAELDAAVEIFRQHRSPTTVLQCTSAYPCPYEQVGLNVLSQMRQRYNLPVGLSDHTLTTYSSFVAVALGATVVEKHFTLSRQMYGSDAQHSLEPPEFTDLVRGIRAVETMLRTPVNKDDVSPFQIMRETFQKSIVTVVDVPQGAVLTRKMLGTKKPGQGIPPLHIGSIVGKKSARALRADTLLQWTDIHA